MAYDYEMAWNRYKNYSMEKTMLTSLKLQWKSMRTNTFVTLFALTCVLLILFYYNLLRLTYWRVDNSPLYFYYNDTDDFLITTPGCFIPNYSKTIKFVDIPTIPHSCGERAVFVNKVSDDDIMLVIENKIFKDKNVECCYEFVSRSEESGKEDTEIKYSSCNSFTNGTTVKLEHEVITVSCSNTNNKTIYKDSYMILKKKEIKENLEENNNWNVLLIGMDTMSRARFYDTMPKSAKYFRENGWLDYRGYQKVEFNTFPNVMSVLTGKTMSTIYHKCIKTMDDCNDLMMWSAFKNASYVTAFGEDYLRLPDTFTPRHGFINPPTDHYMRPLFLTGEEEQGNYVCNNKKQSGKQILDYAQQFASSYQNNSFFGWFWINSYSHNLKNKPSLFDESLVKFFENINNTGVLKNTFVVFLSDHGIRFGDNRLQVESYYEERLPMLFIWTPHKFRRRYRNMYRNLLINQSLLTTPYDLYMSLKKILELSRSNVERVQAEACPECNSLFEEISIYRTCASAHVSEKWCSCRKLIPVPKKDTLAIRSLDLAMNFLENITTSIETTNCNTCHHLSFKSVIRRHYYVDIENNIKYYVLAFTTSPGDVRFEVNIKVSDDDELSIIHPTRTISSYNTRGNCVKHPNDRNYCVCKTIKCRG